MHDHPDWGLSWGVLGVSLLMLLLSSTLVFYFIPTQSWRIWGTNLKRAEVSNIWDNNYSLICKIGTQSTEIYVFISSVPFSLSFCNTFFVENLVCARQAGCWFLEIQQGADTAPVFWMFTQQWSMNSPLMPWGREGCEGVGQIIVGGRVGRLGLCGTWNAVSRQER